MDNVLIKKGSTVFVDGFSEEVYNQTYRYGDETINDTHFRVAQDLASVEENADYWTEKFVEILENFQFVPGGRITSNAGTGLKGTTYINCFVDGFMGEKQDSMRGILDTLARQAMILKSEGGYGFCADVMRPRGAFIGGIGNESPGAVRMLDMWDTQSAVITEGSGRKTEKVKAKVKIRKGAQMVTMSIFHPDIEEYIKAKLTSGKLTKFNMSVLITDEFVDAVKNNKSWNLEFPDYEECIEKYDKEWDGNLKSWKSKGYPTKIYKTYENANELWDVIMTSTYNRNEPGVLFVDTMNRMNNLWYNEYISATNPCLTDDSWITTDKGALQIKDLIGIQFNAIVNGKPYISTDEGFYCTGKKKIYEIITNEGFKLKATSNHPLKKITKLTRYVKETDWVQVSDLKNGDLLNLNNHKNFSWIGEGNKEIGWLLGSLLGDGNISNNKAILEFWGETKMELKEIAVKFIKNNMQFKKGLGIGKEDSVDILERDKTNINSVFLAKIAEQYGLIGDKILNSKIEKTSSDFYKGFLSGWFDSDGTVGGNLTKGISVRLASSILDNLYVAQRMLARIGIISTIVQNRRLEGYKLMPDGKGGNKEYLCKSQHELIISNENILLFRNMIDFLDSEKTKKLNNLISLYKRKPNKENFVVKIKEIKEIGEELVYDCTIPEIHEFDANGLSVHNCGEQILPIGGVCLLGSLNLTQFINFKNKDWDYEKLKQVIPIAIRFMDNVNDKTLVPLESQKENLQNKRRIGLGIMGYGSALMMLKVRYGSENALKLTDKLMNFIANTSYQASALLAKEKGQFPLFDSEKYLQSNFLKCLNEETIDMIKKYGMRNSHLLSIQPTGNSSVFANNVSGGLEPLFMFEYTRTTIMPYAPVGLSKPENIDWNNKTFNSKDNWVWIKEGDESLLKTDFDGYIWKFDKSRGLLRETTVKDYAVRYLESKGEWDSKAEYAVNTSSLNIDEHIDTMSIMAKYIDSAMSKTINLPNEYPYEDFKKLYMGMYDSGTIKGGTTYRSGTMTVVLSEKKVEDKIEKEKNIIVKTTAIKRPKTLECDINHVSVQGNKWVVLVGLLENEAYEVFAFKSKNLQLPIKYKKGKLTKVKRGTYDLELEEGFVLSDVKSHFESDEQEALTRMISTALRHGAEIHFIVDQLLKSEGNIVSFSKAIARTLKNYLKEDLSIATSQECESCGSKNSIIMQEGCYICTQCSSSKCG